MSLLNIAKSLLDNGFCPLPVAPAEVDSSGELTEFTGKNPSYIDASGQRRLVAHKPWAKTLPTEAELTRWFSNPDVGIGQMGGHGEVYCIDLDAKTFESQAECDEAMLAILGRIGGTPPVDRTPSGGYHILVKLPTPPGFTNFKIGEDGHHVGEVLGTGRFYVCAPTVGYNGVPYEVIQSGTPVELPDLATIGVYPSKRKRKAPTTTGGFSFGADVTSGSGDVVVANFAQPRIVSRSRQVTIEALCCKVVQDLLSGAVGGVTDRSATLAQVANEVYGWESYLSSHGVAPADNATALARRVGTALGLDDDRVERILDSIDHDGLYPACVNAGGLDAAKDRLAYFLDGTPSSQSAGAETSVVADTGETVSVEWPVVPQSVIDDIAAGKVSRPALDVKAIFPALLAEALTNRAAIDGTSQEYLTFSLIAAVASTMGRGSLRINGYRVPTLIWSMLVGDPSARKSSVMAAIADPLCDIEISNRKAHASAYRSWKARQQKAIEADRAAKIQGGWLPGRAKSEPVIATDEDPAPVRRPTIAQDITIEALAKASKRGETHGVGFLAMADEASLFFGGVSAYAKDKGQVADAKLLSLWNGAAQIIDRAGADDTDLSTGWSRTSLLCGAQPHKARALTFGRDNDGLASRILFAYPHHVAPATTWIPTEVQDANDAARKTGLYAELAELYAWVDANNQLWGDMRATIPAEHAYVDVCNYYRDLILRTADPIVNATLGKANAHVARVAAVLHAIDVKYGDATDPHHVSSSAIGRAFDLVERSNANLLDIKGTAAGDQDSGSDVQDVLVKILDYLATHDGVATFGRLQSDVSAVRTFVTSHRRFDPSKTPADIMADLIKGLVEAGRVKVSSSRGGFKLTLTDTSTVLPTITAPVIAIETPTKPQAQTTPGQPTTPGPTPQPTPPPVVGTSVVVTSQADCDAVDIDNNPYRLTLPVGVAGKVAAVDAAKRIVMVEFEARIGELGRRVVRAWFHAHIWGASLV